MSHFCFRTVLVNGVYPGPLIKGNKVSKTLTQSVLAWICLLGQYFQIKCQRPTYRHDDADTHFHRETDAFAFLLHHHLLIFRTTQHWHGIFQNGTNEMDGMNCETYPRHHRLMTHAVHVRTGIHQPMPNHATEFVLVQFSDTGSGWNILVSLPLENPILRRLAGSPRCVRS